MDSARLPWSNSGPNSSLHTSAACPDQAARVRRNINNATCHGIRKHNRLQCQGLAPKMTAVWAAFNLHEVLLSPENKRVRVLSGCALPVFLRPQERSACRALVLWRAGDTNCQEAGQLRAGQTSQMLGSVQTVDPASIACSRVTCVDLESTGSQI